jgi:hypothetical protein
MGLFDKLLGKKDEPKAEATSPAATAVACPHTILLPRWDDIADMGNEEKATSFSCQSCGQTFTRAEADALRKTEAERLPGEVPS